MQLYVQPGTYYINGTRYLFPGASTPTVAAPSSHPRIDVLTIDTSGTLAWTVGAENVSPIAPTYPSDKLALCELFNVTGETALYDVDNQQSGQGYIQNDVRPAMSIGPILSAIASDLAPDATDTRNIGESSANEWLNIYAKNIFASTVVQLGGQNVAFAKFGGTGADGALSITSGTTTINLGGASLFVKNYSSISITGTGQLTFSNPAAGGTIIILKSQGNVTLTSSATPNIDLTSIGGSAGSGGAQGGSTGAGSGGGGGASAAGNGGVGNSGGSNAGSAGSSGNGFGGWDVMKITGGGAGASLLGRKRGNHRQSPTRNRPCRDLPQACHHPRLRRRRRTRGCQFRGRQRRRWCRGVMDRVRGCSQFYRQYQG